MTAPNDSASRRRPGAVAIHPLLSRTDELRGRRRTVVFVKGLVRRTELEDRGTKRCVGGRDISQGSNLSFGVADGVHAGFRTIRESRGHGLTGGYGGC